MYELHAWTVVFISMECERSRHANTDWNHLRYSRGSQERHGGLSRTIAMRNWLNSVKSLTLWDCIHMKKTKWSSELRDFDWRGKSGSHAIWGKFWNLENWTPEREMNHNLGGLCDATGGIRGVEFVQRPLSCAIQWSQEGEESSVERWIEPRSKRTGIIPYRWVGSSRTKIKWEKAKLL